MSKPGGILLCAERDTWCMGMVNDDYSPASRCRYKECVLDDEEYVERMREQERRRNELYEASLKDKTEEKTAAGLIRTQNKTRVSILEEEIAFVRKRMKRFYTRGWTRLGDSESKRLAELEKELEKIK